MTDDERGLLNAVIESPDDDVVRLVYADRLQEQDTKESRARAEFIRLQIDHTDFDAASYKIQQRIRYLRRVFCPNGLGYDLGTFGDDLDSSHGSYKWRRGFVSELRCTLAQFVGGKCIECVETGLLIRDGFAYDAACQPCGGTGRTPGLADVIFRDHPVTTVVLTNIEPQDGGFGWWFGFENGVRNEHRHCLPNEIMRYGLQERGGCKYFHTREAAIAAKSRACVDYARGRCGFGALRQIT